MDTSQDKAEVIKNAMNQAVMAWKRSFETAALKEGCTPAKLLNTPERLLPCPFCGTKKEDIVDYAAGISMHSYPHGYRVECQKCSATGPWDDDPVRALTLWDTRPATARALALFTRQRAIDELSPAARALEQRAIDQQASCLNPSPLAHDPAPSSSHA